MHRLKPLRTAVLLFVFTFVFTAPGVLIAQPPAERTLEGTLNVLWGDSEAFTSPEAAASARAKIRWMLVDAEGVTHELAFSRDLAQLHGDFVSWNGLRVRATLAEETGRALDLSRDNRRRAAAITLLESRSSRGGAVTGSQPWITIPCKFADIGSEPENLAFFQNMYANQPAGLDHYWRELSYDAIDVVGSTAIDWLVLPQNQTFYAPTPGSGSSANLDQLFDDCTAAADPFVDFSGGGTPFVGINLMFNGSLDCCAWGGGKWASLDGVSKVWRTTWNPPWAFGNEGVIAHEMGHGFGLPHANNFDGDSSPYDSPWDVMSSATGNSVNDSTYGALGKHINAYHKDRLAWIPNAEKLEVGPGSSATVIVDPLALAATSELRLVTVPIPGSSRWYTVETRDRLGNYDGNLPGFAVIIHEIDPGRQEPSWAVDSDQPPANYGSNEGTMWKVGETFVDSQAEISISILGQVGSGYQVRIDNGDTSLVFLDGFETGDATVWSLTVP